MNVSLKTYEQLIALLRNPHISPEAAQYVRAELRSRDRALRNQETEVFAIGAL